MPMNNSKWFIAARRNVIAGMLGLAVVGSAHAQTSTQSETKPLGSTAQQIPPYGPPLTLEMARQAMAAAEALAARNNWNQAIAIIDSGGHLVMFQKFDNTHLASIPVAQGKARTALDYRRATSTLEQALAAGGGGLRYLGVPGTTPLEGGVPILNDGRIVGAIGASGVASSNDALVAQAGADALR